MALASSGITVSAVKTALGTSNNNIGGLCTNNNINIWSVWKPISLNAPTLTRDLIKNANYGISIINRTTASALLTAVQDNNNLGYTYNKPTGGLNSPYRLGDFRNYNHNAQLPVMAQFKNGDKVDIYGVSSDYSKPLSGIELPDAPDLDSSDSITKGHIYNFKDSYGETYNLTRGALITNGTYTYWSVGEIPWGNTNWQRFRGTECTVLEFLTNLASGTTSVGHTSNGNDRFYAIPEPIHTITVTNNAPAGSKTVFVDYATNSDNKLSFSDSTYNTFVYNFQFSSIGELYRGGTITNVYIGIYSDSNCSNLIAQRKLADSITLGSEEKSTTYFGTLSNTTGSSQIYVGFYWNNSLQFKTMAISVSPPPTPANE